MKPTTVDEYFATLTKEQAKDLQKVRQAIHKAIPNAQEKISYAIPAVVLQGRPNLHFAAWKEHIGIYPVFDLPKDLAAEAEPYRKTKSMLGFKYKDGMPLDLIERVASDLANRSGKQD